MTEQNSNTIVEFTTESDYRVDREALTHLSVDSVRSYVKAQQAFSVDVENRSQNATNRAAYATYVAEHILHILFQPKKQQTSEHMTGEQWAASFGKTSKSLVTGWRTLGQAIIVVGLDVDGDTYTRLRNSNAYAQGEVRKYLMSSGATEEGLLPILAKYADENGGRIKQEGTPNTPANKSDEQKQRDAAIALADMILNPGEGENAHKAVKAAVGTIDDCARGLSFDDWAEVSNRLEAIIKRENGFRAESLNVAKKAEADKPAPRRRAAKKVA